MSDEAAAMLHYGQMHIRVEEGFMTLSLRRVRKSQLSARGGVATRAGALGAALILIPVLGACSNSSTTPSTSSTSVPAIKPHSTTTSQAAGSPSTTAPFYEVTTGSVKGLGTVLVDGSGLTLYMFEPDKQSGNSTCYGSCANGWPPLLLPSGATSPVAGGSAKPSLLGTTKRTDGTVQVTYNRWPLYLWVGDSQPGQATGQALNNLGGLWYVLNPAGAVITAKP